MQWAASEAWLSSWAGANVIGTASALNRDFLRELGANEVIDYTSTRFEDMLHDIDIVLDTIGGDTMERSWSVLKKGGLLVSVFSSHRKSKLKRTPWAPYFSSCNRL